MMIERHAETQQPSYEELMAERDRLLQQQRQLLLERRYMLLAVDAVTDEKASQRERALALYVIRMLRKTDGQANGTQQ